ncbi:MAG: carboxypeptidase-like regulatory domain-containing protein [Bacteroidota bacterium]|nr:carboxypeptidase-like regulatory domain-containing protein [Bacteroidota bacterium]
MRDRIKRFINILFRLLLILLASNEAVAQIYILKGSVLDKDSSFALPNSYVVNNKTFAGTVTNGIGYFEIPVTKGDTIVFSNVGYQFKYLGIDSNVISNIKTAITIKLSPRNYLLDEVSIYAITSNNPRTMPQSKPSVPSDDEIRIPQAVAPTLANPLDLLYYSFGKRPKQLAALRRLQREDYYRQKLEEGNNRESLEELTGIPREEMEAFMFYCKYSDTKIRTLNDYQFLISLLECYEEFERNKKRQEAIKNYK